MINLSLIGYFDREKVQQQVTKNGKPFLKLRVYLYVKEECQNWDALVFNEKVISAIQRVMGEKNKVYLEGVPSVLSSEGNGKIYTNRSVFVNMIEVFPLQPKSTQTHKEPINNFTVEESSFNEDDIPF